MLFASTLVNGLITNFRTSFFTLLFVLLLSLKRVAGSGTSYLQYKQHAEELHQEQYQQHQLEQQRYKQQLDEQQQKPEKLSPEQRVTCADVLGMTNCIRWIHSYTDKNEEVKDLCEGLQKACKNRAANEVVTLHLTTASKSPVHLAATDLVTADLATDDICVLVDGAKLCGTADEICVLVDGAKLCKRIELAARAFQLSSCGTALGPKGGGFDILPSVLGGVGVFARTGYFAGELIELCPTHQFDTENTDAEGGDRLDVNKLRNLSFGPEVIKAISILQTYALAAVENGRHLSYLSGGYCGFCNHGGKTSNADVMDRLCGGITSTALYAVRDIAAGEEILWDYGTEYFTSRGKTDLSSSSSNSTMPKNNTP